MAKRPPCRTPAVVGGGGDAQPISEERDSCILCATPCYHPTNWSRMARRRPMLGPTTVGCRPRLTTIR
eukprot:6320575-Lingulodinium_polyedra.AAC.1